MNIWKKHKIGSDDSGFTIIEIVIVTVIIGIIAAFGFPYFNKTFETTHELEAIAQLERLWHAQQLFYARYNCYWPATGDDGFPSGGETRGYLDNINDILDIQIVPDQVRYGCLVNDDPDQFFCGAILENSSSEDTMRVTQLPLSKTGPSPNPCCQSGHVCHVVENCP